MNTLRYIGLIICCLTAATASAQQEDQQPPVIKKIDTELDTIYKFIVFDNGPRDSGLQSIDLQIEEELKDHYIITIEPPVIPCSRDTHVVTIVSKRPIYGLHLTSVFTDCAGNTSGESFIGDFFEEIPPVIVRRTKLTDSTRSMDVKDPLSGIRDITFPGLDASRFTTSITPPLWLCSPEVHKIIVTDRGGPVRACAQVRIVDCQHNFRIDSICFEAKVGVEASRTGDAFEIIGRSGSDIQCQLEMSMQSAVRISVIDILGRTHLQYTFGILPSGVHQIPIGGNLSEGHYSIVAEWGGKQYTKKLSVVK